MTTAMKFLFFGLMALAISTTSCSKEGPVGPESANGEQGPPGPEGTTNVFVSDWLEPTEASFRDNTARYKSLPLEAGLSKSIVKEGVLLVYLDDEAYVQLLPRYSFSNTGSVLRAVESKIILNGDDSGTLYVTIRSYDSDMTSESYTWDSSATAGDKGIRYRHVLIPKMTSGKNSVINFKKMSYEEVLDYFDL